MNIGKKIKELRNKNGLTQSNLAVKAGLSKNAIWNYENNKRKPNIETLNKIADALGVSFKQLTSISIEKRINDLMKEKNISIDDIVKKTGLLKEQIPINEDELKITQPTGEVLNKISDVFNISLEELLKDTFIENQYLFTDEEQKAIDNLANNINKISERNNIPPKERRELNNISIHAMALLLDTTESEIEKFEKEPYRNFLLRDKYKHELTFIEMFREDLFSTIINSNNSNLKFILNLPTDQYVKFINYISTNINLVTDMIKFSRIDIDNSNINNSENKLL